MRHATGSFEVQEYRKPEFEVSVTPAERFVVQGDKVSATITRALLLRPARARTALVTYALYKSSYYSPLRWQDDADERVRGLRLRRASRLAKRRRG